MTELNVRRESEVMKANCMQRLGGLFEAVVLFTASALVGFAQEQALQPDPARKRPDQSAFVRQRAEKRKPEREAQARAQAELKGRQAVATYARQKVSPKLLEKYDKNGNGVLDRSEWEKHRKEIERVRAGRIPDSSATP
jgi:nitrogen fixation/metabolism regulation signal transduction histidine kinase